MSLDGSDQLEKAMEEVLDDDDEVKVEKSNVEKMEKHSNPEPRVLEQQPAGIDSGLFRSIYNECTSFTNMCVEMLLICTYYIL